MTLIYFLTGKRYKLLVHPIVLILVLNIDNIFLFQKIYLVSIYY